MPFLKVNLFGVWGTAMHLPIFFFYNFTFRKAECYYTKLSEINNQHIVATDTRTTHSTLFPVYKMKRCQEPCKKIFLEITSIKAT